MAGGFFDTSNQAGIDSELSVNPAGTESPTYSTQEDSPGGFFQTGEGEVGVQGIPVEVANAAAREAAKNAAGWAVGDSDTELSGWSATRNAKAYSNDAAQSASEAADSANAAAQSAELAEDYDSDARLALAATETARDAALAAQDAAETAARRADSDVKLVELDSERISDIVREIQADSEEVRLDRQRVKADSEDIADYARTTKADSEYVAEARRGFDSDVKVDSEVRSDYQRQLDSDIKADSEARTEVQRAIEFDSEQADSDARRAELEADVAQAYSRGQGPLASYWASTDTDQGSHTFSDPPNGTRSLFDLNGLGTDRGVNIQGHTYRLYINFNRVADDRFEVSDGIIGAIDSAFLRIDSDSEIPATGDRMDLFLIPPGNRTYGPHSHPYISSEESAIWLAETSANNVIQTQDTFINNTDTPNSYADQEGEYVRVNSDTDALEFFDPFPVTNNRLSRLNGLRIREFNNTTGEIVFAVFTPSNLGVRATPSNAVNWDAPVTGFTFFGDNDSFDTDNYLTSISNYTVNSIARTISTTYTSFAASRTWEDTTDFVDAANWGGGAVTYTVAGTINDSTGGTHAQSQSFGWNAAGWSSSGSGNIGTLDFDETRSSFTVTGTVQNTSDHSNITAVSTSTDQGTAGSPTRSNNNYTSTITATNNLYHDSDVSGTWTATFTKPTSVSSASDRAQTITSNWTRSYTTGYKTWAVLSSSSVAAESVLGTLSNNGYAASEVRSGDTSTSTWRGRTYTFNNSSGGTSMTGFLIAPSSIDPATSFTNPDVQNAVYSGVTRTQINLGQAGHQVAYYFYAFTVGAGNTIRVTVA